MTGDYPQNRVRTKAVLRSTVTKYPEADFIALRTPEFRQWTENHEAAWDALDRDYGVGEVISLPEVLARARQRTGYPGGAEESGPACAVPETHPGVRRPRR
jgi:hypothetical protein